MPGGPHPPTLAELGRDLLLTSRGRLAFVLAAPFACTAGFFVAAARGDWAAALLAAALLSFFTYGSTSHDLVHRNLGLPPLANEILLAATEAVALRSGHAYRISHLHHHRRFPEDDDAEGIPAGQSLGRVLLASPFYVHRLWLWSWRRASAAERASIAGETALGAAYLVAAVVLRDEVPALLVYAALLQVATWVFPVALVYLQHDRHGETALLQTRAYRGRIVPALLLHHLYHLEHHLYPAVPAHHWRELARRLDPFLGASGVKLIRIP